MKKLKNSKILKYIWIVYAIVSIIISIYLIDRIVTRGMKGDDSRIYLEDNWKVQVNDEIYENVNLKEYIFDDVSKGDKIIIERTIPEEWNLGQAAFCIHNKHSVMTMFIDDEIKYEYGKDRFELNKTTGSGYLFINFYDEYKGKTLKIEFFVTENSAFSKIDEMWIGEWANAQRYIITENRLAMYLGSFLIVFGVMVTFIRAFAVMVSTKYWKVLWLSIFSICIGLWTLCYYNIMIIFDIPLYSISLMEYMSLFLAPIPIIAYMHTYVKDVNEKLMMRLYKILFAGQIVCSTVTITLHTADIVHGAAMLPKFQLVFIVEIIFFVIVLKKRMKNNEKMRKFTTVGLVIVVGCVIYELLKYSVKRYLGYDLLEVKGISSIGFLVFMEILVIDLYHRVTMSRMEEHEKEILIRRAFIDELTGVYNRAYCSDIMHKISENSNSKFAIVNFDLNDLKKTNDAFGHIAGDKLICSAANVLEKAFSEYGVVGRMGGDEFIAIIEDNDKQIIDELLTNLEKYIKDENEANPTLGLSISYGYAIGDELQGANTEKVYQLADARMYECKKIKKGLK